MQIITSARFGTKEIIETIVHRYVTNYAVEFELFKQYMGQKRAGLYSDFAEVRKGEGVDMLERGLHEIPATLQEMFTRELSYEDDKWLQSKEGGRWFAKRFPVFASGNKV